MEDYNIPTEIKAEIDRYANSGIMPFGFVKSILANDLAKAIYLSDTASYHFLAPIVYYIFDTVPHVAWGDYIAIDNWIERFKGI